MNQYIENNKLSRIAYKANISIIIINTLWLLLNLVKLLLGHYMLNKIIPSAILLFILILALRADMRHAKAIKLEEKNDKC